MNGRMARGRAAEEQVAQRIRELGYPVESFGQALLSQAARDAIKKTESLLRWLPDFFVPGSHPRPSVTVDAKACSSKYLNHSIEMRSLAAARDVVAPLPVLYVCPDRHAITAGAILDEGPDETCCDRCWKLFRSDLEGLPKYCPKYVARGGADSSKTPFVLISKARHCPVERFFPRQPLLNGNASLIRHLLGGER